MYVFYSTISSLPFQSTSLFSTSDSNSPFDSSSSESTINLDMDSVKTSRQLTLSKMTHNRSLPVPSSLNTVMTLTSKKPKTNSSELKNKRSNSS